MSSIKEERDETAGAIRYIKFSGDYDKFDERKEKTKKLHDTSESSSIIQRNGKSPKKKMQKMIQISRRFMKETAKLGIS